MVGDWATVRFRIYYVAFICLLIGLYYVVPGARMWVFGSAGCVTAVVVAASAVARRSPRMSAWLLLSAGILVVAAGEVSYHALTYSRGADFGYLPGVFYIAAYAPLAVGVLWLGLGRSPSRDAAAVIETSVLTLAGVLVVWISLMKPMVVNLDLTGVGKVVAVAGSVSNVVILAGIVQLLRVWWRNVAAVLLAGGFVALAVENLVYAISLDHRTWQTGAAVAVAPLVFFGLCGTAALTPSMEQIGSTRIVRQHLGMGELFALAVALLVAPTVLLVEATPGPVQTPVAIAVVSGTVGLLVLLRLFGAARDHHLALKREDDIRHATRQLGSATTPDAVVASLASVLAAMADGPTTAVRLNDLPQDAPGAEPATHLRLSVRGGASVTGDAVDDGAHEIVFTAAGADLVELEDVLAGLTDQAGVALQRIDLAARARESEKQQDALAYRATHDGLTGLANAEQFRSELAVAAAGMKPEAATAVLFVDLDDFKSINDTLGHGAGDEVLVQSAQRIRAHLRDDDRAARLGGDEFAVLLPDVTDSGANDVARRITQAFAQPVVVSGVPVLCRASVGVATASTVSDHDTLLRRADAALYAAKADGKGRWRSFDPAAQGSVRRGRDLRTELDKLMHEDLASRPDDHGLTVHYQPIVDLSSGVTRGFEALPRWHHPTRGDIAAPEIIDIAESTGVIMRLGDWVLDRALNDAATLGAAGTVPRYVSVNVFAAQLIQPGFAERLRDQLGARGIGPKRLVVEITESRLMCGDERIWTDFSQLRDLGVRVAIDDFGTGYASLAHLRHPVIDIVKLDRAFLGHLDEARNRTIVESVIALTDRIGLDLIANGIENQTTCSALVELGCPFGQGQLFAAAMPKAEALRWNTRRP
jgi:diguanylate cyclase (GGDEF)-like protein